MTLTEALLGINKEIRQMEDKVAKESKGTNHILHLLLSVFTAGIWLIVWVLIVMSNTNIGSTSNEKKLEELYTLRDEAELKLRMKGV